MPYRIDYSPDARMHLKGLTKRKQEIVDDNIAAQLAHQPLSKTMNRKPMRPNPLTATWELRLGDLRVYYNVEEEPEQLVYILAIGIKKGNHVLIGGKILDLEHKGLEE